jgi:hypothetical protein
MDISNLVHASTPPLEHQVTTASTGLHTIAAHPDPKERDAMFRAIVTKLVPPMIVRTLVLSAELSCQQHKMDCHGKVQGLRHKGSIGFPTRRRKPRT